MNDILNITLSKVTKEQDEMISYVKGYGIDPKVLVFENEYGKDVYGEVSASILELVLEGLRSLKPPILDKRENIYVSA